MAFVAVVDRISEPVVAVAVVAIVARIAAVAALAAVVWHRRTFADFVVAVVVAIVVVLLETFFKILNID